MKDVRKNMKEDNKLIFNTSFFVEAAIEKEFLVFLTEEYIPAAEGGGMSLVHLSSIRSSEADEAGARAYAVQLACRDEQELDRFRGRVMEPMLATVKSRWGMGVMHFSTLMDAIAYGTAG